MSADTLILIVEGNPELGMRLTRDVRRYAGASAAELLQEYAAAVTRLSQPPFPCIVVMEYRLPDRTGIDLALWMAEQAHLVGTYRVLYTATSPALVARDPALIAWDPARAIREEPVDDTRAYALFALVVAKGVDSGPRVLAEALRGLPGWLNRSEG